MATLKDESKKDYTTASANATVDELKIGALQRIADACETMCRDRRQLEKNFQYVKNSRDYFSGECDRLRMSNAALRGVITKMKKKLKEQGK